MSEVPLQQHRHFTHSFHQLPNWASCTHGELLKSAHIVSWCWQKIVPYKDMQFTDISS